MKRITKRLAIDNEGTAHFSARCRMGRSQRFSILDRLRFLFGGKIWVVTVNGKAHTQVLLAMQQPTDDEQEAARRNAARV